VPSWKPPEWFQNLPAIRSLRGVSLNFGPDWTGQALILDPASGLPPDVDVPFLATLARQVTPAIYSIFLLRRLRSHAGAVERARVARELHDGVIQALIGLEMKVDVLRRQTGATRESMAEELKRIQNLMHQEVLNLRELMQQMRPVDVAPTRFLDYLATTVDKFGRDVGLSAHFVSPFDEVVIHPRTCTEVARIVQEALVNIRKHSHARNVLVRFEAHEDNWRLMIDDDGRGFDFTGRLGLLELEARRLGPLVIRERVRTIGGELVVESGPGKGARLEITFPRRG
jgi:two-component system sensor histidine kinase DegS